ncbi:hypothetical protein [Campylobacter sp. RM15925]|uniref:hypothetical protein n=1 Tax=Campylobacter sp. RM15925 TaxID=1705724 RepID=UPI001475B3B1|nr:hypothetical protein [Campylobacter sp. RM15925]
MFIDKIKNKFINSNKETILYAISFIMLLILALLNFNFELKHNVYIKTLCFLSILLCIYACLSHYFKFVKKIWKHWIGKIILTISNLIIYFLAKFIAMYAISITTGLPPQDFEFSVEALTALLYIPSAIITFYVFISFFLILSWISLVARMFLDMIFDGVTKIVNFNKPQILNLNLFGRVTGIMFVNILSCIMISMALTSADKTVPYISKLIFYLDYYQLSNHPDIPQDKYVHIHNNNIISIAKPSDAQVTFTIYKLEN